MAGNGWKGWKWLEMAGKAILLEMVGNGWKLVEIEEKILEIDRNCWNSWKLLK